MQRPGLALMILGTALLVTADAQTVQLLPELDVYYKPNQNLRVYFQAKDTREGGLETAAELGPSVEVYLKKLSKLADISVFGLDDSKSQLLVFSVGYRYLPYPNAPAANRLEPYVILDVPMKGRLLLSDQNRADLDWAGGQFSWRYRNRVEVERWVSIHYYHLAPYVSAEFFYESTYGKWSDTAVYAGCRLPIGRHAVFGPYYEHQNNTGSNPNQQLNQFGLMLNLYFSGR